MARALPDFVRILATGDRTLDGPTEDDFVPVGGLHIGVVSADLGTAGYPQAGCAVGSVINYGALMFTHGDPTRSECLTEYPETSSLATVDAAGAFSLGAALDCVLSAVSSDDCGSSQPLEAALVAAESSGIPGSQLTIIVVSDADDCSVGADGAGLFDPAAPLLAGTPATRCIDYADLLTTLDAYRGLVRPSHALVNLVVLAGIPTDLLPTALGPPDYATLLADPRVMPRVEVDAAGEPRIAPSCSSSFGDAEPPRRLVELASSLGSRAVLGTLCDGELATDVARAAVEIGEEPYCVGADLASLREADGFIGCEQLIALSPDGATWGWPTTCAELPGADPTPYRRGADGAVECRLRQLPVVDGVVGANPTTGERRGWYFDDFSDDVQRMCGAFEHPGRFARLGLTDLPRYSWPPPSFECCGSRR